MKNSRTLLLIEEAFQKTKEFNYKRYIEEIGNLGNSGEANRAHKHPVNIILEKFGLHLMHKSLVDELEGNSYSKMGKWSSVGTLQLVLKNPEEFDKVYNMLADEESEETFDWFVKFRVAYAFLGEIAAEIYPTQISKEDYFKKINQLKFDKYGSLLTVGGYYFNSRIEETADSWMFEQYGIKAKLEVTSGDYVIDGGAFRGETSFWFLSKGAGKVYAFEPDHYNFSILSDNIKRNKVLDRIIPVQNILSDRNEAFSLYATSSGASTVLEGGNETVKGVTLDTFLEKERQDRVDFIKLDVEGSELQVLKGAVETIKKFRPKMAISVYHKPEDIIEIPKFLHDLLPDAKAYLRHSSHTICETILFVNPRD